ncbi:MAG: hypothetical protein FJW21_07020 [Acidimicrobiia bacterium]|nr:hypothetical protein [Acidimicrobiia bacterium]
MCGSRRRSCRARLELCPRPAATRPLVDHDVSALVAALAPDFYVAEDALRRAVRGLSSVNFIDNATMLKVDL